jgi:hypothetical protein
MREAVLRLRHGFWIMPAHHAPANRTRTAEASFSLGRG